MDKKDNSGISEIDYNIDEELERVAKKKVRFNDVYLVAIFLICLGILIGVHFLNTHINNNDGYEMITQNNTSVYIANNGNINEHITNKVFDNNDKYVIEVIDSIAVLKDKEDYSKVKYNVRYEILENDFPFNTISSKDSKVLVRFAYSYDKKEWTYINNSITIGTDNISPLMGKNYDISGVKGTLKVETDMELSNKVVYWKSETIFRSFNEKVDNKYVANFKIEVSNK